jgi:hypothetical protein
MSFRRELSTRTLALSTTAVVLLALVGCSSELPTGDVSGTVSFKGQPIPLGRITFLADDGREAFGGITDGQYSVPNAPTGPVRIGISSIVTLATPIASAQPGRSQAARRSMRGLAPVGKDSDPSGKTASKPGLKIPDKYGSPKNSGLTFQVEKGTQTHDIDLKP